MWIFETHTLVMMLQDAKTVYADPKHSPKKRNTTLEVIGQIITELEIRTGIKFEEARYEN